MRRKRLLRLVWCVVFVAVLPCLADSVPATITPVTPVKTTETATVPLVSVPASATTTAQSSQNAQIWNLKNADIRAVIQTISVLTGKNFIIDPSVHGNITLVSQKPMTPNELYHVFLSMLQLLNYSAIPSGNVIKIVPSTEGDALTQQIATGKHPGAGDEIVVRVVPVDHVSATELVPVLRPLISKSDSVTAYMPSNSLILAGSAANMNRLVDVIHQMDSADANQISVVHLHYANAKKMVDVIHALQNGSASQGNVNNVTLAPDEDENSILISGNATNQLLMRHLIRSLDQKGSGGDDTAVIRLNYLEAKKLAPILTKVAKGMSASPSTNGKNKSIVLNNADTDGAKDVSIQAEISTNSIIIHAPKAMMDSLKDIVHRLDARPQEVLVEAIIVNMDQNLLNKLGIVWGTAGGAATDAAAAAVAAGDATAAATAAIDSANTAALKIAPGGVGFLPNSNLVALLHALKSDGSSDILATPSVVVLDNQKASIADGQNIGVANTQFQGTAISPTPSVNIVSPYNAIQREDVALSLDVVPHVSPNKMIRLSLLQQDNSIASLGASNADNPTLNTNKIETSVLVRSGKILVLGGLVSNDQEKTTQKVPILGDLPLIGHLFRYDKTSMEKKSLMVFIRPIIMSKDISRSETSNRYKYIRHQEIQMQTEKLSDQNMPMLPPMNETRVTLPKPINNMSLPLPTETDEK